ncbi:hypothetical protein ANOM_011380 [Aspergillus nomiae NRRL 13137]|uniref:Uncharacterized protein n=1 Tax=Aspergillus nomiae NRRL (strain ATCC 15546 / NRRL 13137 / CBS 260.88 / M93) TaxID=1509407 RepID=A0A0L1IM32_ASPN3|nr:uncharacterized protein ANOM_011380 [Aspergillus nomiae NRRL 13137]KNG80233.1 hypothetical protein ANOM_011380 [Aspergillus nomiae NRRL 13137]
MAISIRAQQDKEEAETCLPGFGGGLGITWPPSYQGQLAARNPGDKLPTIFEEDESF